MSAPQLVETPVASIPATVARLRATHATGKTLPVAYRKEQLLAVVRLIEENEAALNEAVRADLNKSTVETRLCETLMALNDIKLALDELDSWLKPERPSVKALNKFDGAQIRRDPLGTVLIMGAWNYPLQLVFVPLIGAIAGGNCALIKPSELSVRTAQLVAELIPRYLDRDAVAVVNGGVDQSTALLAQRFDLIFYTGGGFVGRVVMRAAAEHLTPVVLELGGKSPCYVDRQTDLRIAARRIAWGRFMNAGQTCVAPDYVLIRAEQQAEFITHLRNALNEFYGANPHESKDYGRIVNDRHFQRLSALIDSRGASARIEIGGERVREDRFIAPTVITGVAADAPVMQEEIFGPILPIVNVRDAEEAIAFINARDKPLALYVFSDARAVGEAFLQRTSSGGVVINDTLMHATCDALPFGGVGASGMGAYHGKHSFDVFTHKKSVMVKDLSLEGVNKIRYPPYTASQLSWVNRLMQPSFNSNRLGVGLAAVAAVAAVAVALHQKGFF